MTSWLAVDPGHKRIGLAAGDTETCIATPVRMIEAKSIDQDVARILAAAAEYGAEGIVVGWPINMDDTEGPQALAARELARRIAGATDLDVRLWDERLSSFTADNFLAGQLTRKKRRARQDSIAAATILQDFLSSRGPQTAPRPDDRGG